MSKSEILFVIKSFVIWRIGISVIAFLAIRFIPLFSQNYLGGGFSNYSINPLFWGHVNFDGEHYLAIAQNGYRPLEYFFFPLFPKLIDVLSIVKTQVGFVWTGLIISNVCFLACLLGFYKLVKLDFSDKIATLVVIFILVFPTSFYFGTYYTESLFLMFVVWSFYFARRSNFFLASVLAAFASATRVVGGILFVVMVVEYLQQIKFDFGKINLSKVWPVASSPLGVLTYMYYLLRQTGDPLIFLHQVSIFGQQRSSTLVLLPQVFYRYVFEILPHVSYSFFPNVFTTYLEFICGTLFLVLVLISFFKLRISYAFYGFFAYFIPTLAGSFSSMPRYALALFPAFILVVLYFDKLPRVYKYLVIFGMIVLMAVSTAMFWRGYWIA